jgi:DNA helicase HerA-like ATPase
MFDGFQFHRILSAPRPPEDPQRPDPTPTQLFAALVGAHAELSAQPEGAAGRAAIAVGWLRLPGDPYVRFLAGGHPFFPPAVRPATGGGEPGGRRTGATPLLYPPGSTAVRVNSASVTAALDAFPCWLRCAGAPDALWAPDRDRDRDVVVPRRGSFDDYAAHFTDPYAWLVVAQPVPAAASEAERAGLLRSIPVLRKRENDQNARLELERAEARYRELTKAGSSGMWDVHVLAGGMTPASAHSLAALFSSSSDLDRLPYVLTVTGSPASFAAAWGTAPVPASVPSAASPAPATTGSWDGRSAATTAGTGAGARAGAEPAAGGMAGGVGGGVGGGHGGGHGAAGAGAAPRSPFRAGADLLAAIARPPTRELPGITLVTPHTFDVTPEVAMHVGPARPGGPGRPGMGEVVVLGEVLDAAWAPAGAMPVPHATLNRHAFVCGATGSGKSQTVRSLLESLARAPNPVPWLVLEPAKAEYARMAGRLAGHGEVLVVKPGRLDAPPASLNPLEPEPGFPLQSHIDLVRALFLAAFEAHEPFPQVLARALTVCYQDRGWNLVLDRPEPVHRPKLFIDGPHRDPDVPVRRRYPTLGDLQRTAGQVVTGIGYGAEVTADVRGFIDVRIGSLREGTPGRFFEGGHPIDIGALLERNVVFELEDITNDQDKAFLLGAVLIRVVEHLRVRYGGGGADGLRHVLVVEEAHRLLKNTVEGPAAAAVELFASLLAEIRAYGEGVVVVEQIPAKILPDVIKNTALKVVHRLPAADDRDAVGATMNLQADQSELVVALPAGVAAVAVDGMDRPVLVRMTPGDDRESPDRARFDAAPLAGRRSRLCGTECVKGTACTLAETETAAGLAGEARLVVWVEAVAAHQVMGFDHLLGVGPPVPSPALRATLAALPARTLACVLAHAADRAVTARQDGLRGHVDSDDFADRLSETLTRLLDTASADAAGSEYSEYSEGMAGYSEGMAGAGDPASAGAPADTAADTRRWTAGLYRWQDVRRTLVEATRGPDADAGPHPQTAAWRDRGLILDGRTATEQLAQLKHSAIYAHGQDHVSLGDTAASGLAAAVRHLAGGTTAECLTYALRLACSGAALSDLVDQVTDLLDNQATTTPGRQV